MTTNKVRTFVDLHNILSLAFATSAVNAINWSTIQTRLSRSGYSCLSYAANSSDSGGDQEFFRSLSDAKRTALVLDGPKSPLFTKLYSAAQSLDIPVVIMEKCGDEGRRAGELRLDCLGEQCREEERANALVQFINDLIGPGASLENDSITFGHVAISQDQIFYETEYSIAFVNIRPVVPGHVIVIPRRRCPRFTNLTAQEVADLWWTAQKVGKELEKYHKATSLSLAIQDGPDAGQSVAHVHVHVLPRKFHDVGEDNDVIYEYIDESSDDLSTSVLSTRTNANTANPKARRRKAVVFDPLEKVKQQALGNNLASPISSRIVTAQSIGETNFSRNPVYKSKAEMAQEANSYRSLFSNLS